MPLTVGGVRPTDRSTSQDEQARNGSIWERMCRYKQAIIEPREAFQFKLVLIKRVIIAWCFCWSS